MCMNNKGIMIAIMCCLTMSIKAQVYAGDTGIKYPTVSMYDPQVMSMAFAHAEMAARLEAKRQELFKDYAELAYDAYRESQWNDVIYYVNNALNTTYYNADVYFIRGYAYEHLGNYKQAKKDYKKAKKYGNYKAVFALDNLKIKMKKK